MAAAHVDDEFISGLRGMISEVDETTSVEGLVAHDLDFHHAIVALSGNAYLTSLIDSLSGHTVRARIWRGLTEQNSISRTLAEHRALVDALAVRDAPLARALAVVHVSGVEQWLQTWVSGSEQNPSD
jgi:GntR family transcriptional repressor for pyruvate dehydrogenase complex